LSEISDERKRKYGVNSENIYFVKQLLTSIWDELADPLVYYLLGFLVSVLIMEYSIREYP
jgi:hypothetical protein